MTDLFDEIHTFINSTKPEVSKLLTDEQIDTLLTSYLTQHSNADVDELVEVIRWGEQVAVQWSLFELIQEGLVYISKNEDGEFVFGTFAEKVDK